MGETGIEDLLYKFEGVDYRPLVIPNLRPSIADHGRLLRDFEGVLDYCVQSPTVRTLVIDSSSFLWKSVREVLTNEGYEASGRKRKQQTDYELANEYFEQIVQVARPNTRLNVVLVHRHREIYAMRENESGKSVLTATGTYEAKDYKGIENLVQIMVQTGVGKKFNPITKDQEVVSMHRIELCRFNRKVEGDILANMDYETLMRRVYGEVHPLA